MDETAAPSTASEQGAESAEPANATGEGRAPQEDHAGGLIEATPEELAKLQSNRVVDVQVNELGLSRINDERQTQGLPRLSALDATISTVMPAHVDNSALPSFPPIRNQGSLNSCVPFATSYYQLTHNAGLAMGWWTKKDSDNTNKFSPKWAYNMLNGGVNGGTGFWDNYFLLEKHGSVPWAKLPYDGNYRGWDLVTADWLEALSFRTAPVQAVTAIDTAAGLATVKQLLVNGYVLVVGTYINSWQFKNGKNDPTTSADDPYVGKPVAYWLNGSLVSHAVTIVGYDDEIWVDINNNGVVDAGEKGAFRIANSWGSTWREGGFTWLAYDALKQVSAVPGAPSSGRVPAVQFATAFHLPVRPFYAPKLVSQFTVSQAKRNDLYMYLGISSTSATLPSTTWYGEALFGQGGPYAFNGTTTAVSGTFVLDATDLIPAGVVSTNRYYVQVYDVAAGSPSTLSAYSLIDLAHKRAPQVYAGTLPVTADGNSSQYVWLDATFDDTNVRPVPALSASTATGLAPLAVTFDATGSRDPNGTIASTTWSFGDGSPSVVGSKVTHSYATAGYYTATVTVTDDAGASSSRAVLVHVLDKTPPAVSISAPLAGATVSGTAVPLSASASDNVAVARVELFVDGLLVGTDWSAPFSVGWNSRAVVNGSHTVLAKAYDFDGNAATSGTISFVTNNDFTAPTVAVTSPASGATLTGVVTATANATDNVGISKVQFFLDGTTLMGTATTSPYSVSWNSALVPNKVHTITAKAFDKAGNAAVSSGVSVTTSNVDAIAPTVSLTAPTSYASVTGTVAVSAKAADNFGVARVDFYLDGTTLIGTDSASPFSIAWNTSGVSHGSHVLVAKAFDAAGNNTTSASITVYVY